MVEKVDLDCIDFVVFDVDGTLYRKDVEYIYGNGSIQTAQDFFRFLAYNRIVNSKQSLEEISANLILEYQSRIKDGSLHDAINSVSQEVKNEYLRKIDQYGSNGKVFIGEFGTDSKYLHEMLKHIEFSSILSPDFELQDTFRHLLDKNYTLGILTTEVYDTVNSVANTLGFDLEDFYMNTGNEFPILCAENVKEKKPSPEGFEKILQIYGIDNPKRAVYVGDHFNKDIEAPLRCGLQAIHITNSGPKVSLERALINGKEHEYYRLNSVYDLKEIL